MPEKPGKNREQLKEITDRIEAGIRDIFESGDMEKYRNYLRTMSRFHNYSLNNQALIHLQRPDVTFVAGYNRWRDKFSRHVLRGEKGITIIAPTPYKKKIEQEKLDPDTNDEAALSYAEIKALCAGDERIREKMDLDVDVARLRLMKANHQSQQYRLEDNILRHFPAQIEENKGFLSGFEADMRTLEAHPHPKDGFAGMEVKGDFLTDKDNAGAAILEAFKDAKGLESVPIGTYRGFSMSLTVENFGKDFILTLKGKMSHRVELGKDARGNLVRIDNALAQMPERYKTVQGRLENVQAQLATAKAELGKPFPQEAELKEKSARLAELNAELNIDDRTPMEQAAENVVAKRPSVLGKLKAPSVHGAGDRKKSHEQEAR